MLARVLAGKVEVQEFSLGIYFGVWLGLMPVADVQDGTGWLGLSTSWLAVLLLFLVLKASIPLGLLAMGLAKLAGIAFLDPVSWSVGRALLENVLPEGFGRFCYERLPSAQLHTYWGLGAMLTGPLLALLAAVPMHWYLSRKLPAWRERFSGLLVVRGMQNSVVMKALGWWLE